MKAKLIKSIRTLLPLLLGGGILYWMYREFDFRSISHVLWNEMDWTWMLLSMPFGILAQALRGWRWYQTLEPLAQAPVSRRSCVSAVYVSYAASLLVPRIGEFTRCALLKRWDGVSFSKAIGTVVTERAVDTLTVLLYSAVILLFQLSVFGTFFRKTGMSFDGILNSFSVTGYLVTALCAVAVMLLAHLLFRNLSIYNKVKMTLGDIWDGVVSLRRVRNLPLYLLFTAGIWVCYFLHFYLTFFCFDFTASLGLGCALVAFIVGNFAVIVPTPNGAGPWHFAVKTMLILYGVADQQALYFVLIVHTLQTFLVVLLGIYGMLCPKR